MFTNLKETCPSTLCVVCEESAQDAAPAELENMLTH
jgi:hypothetical protein